MTKEELEKEANKQSYLYDIKYSEDYTLEDRLNRPKDFVKGAIKDLIDLLKRKAYRDGYIAGAEPREKRIAELEAKHKDLEWQFWEVVKDNDCWQAENKRLEKENAELKEKLNQKIVLNHWQKLAI